MINKEKTEFDIRIKDNFFKAEDFNKIKQHVKNIVFSPDETVYTNEHGKRIKNENHVWFTTDAPKEICDILLKQVSSFFKVKILNMSLCQFTLVAKSDKVQVHRDLSDATNFQIIIYIEGDENIHSGTGFYIEKEKNKYELNTHIGFKPNRIVSWASNVYHAPLSFTDSYKKRISLIAQYKIEKETNDK